jgi:hypothetical protein
MREQKDHGGAERPWRSRKTMEEQRWCREEVRAEATFSGVLVRGKSCETSV